MATKKPTKKTSEAKPNKLEGTLCSAYPAIGGLLIRFLPGPGRPIGAIPLDETSTLHLHFAEEEDGKKLIKAIKGIFK